MWKTRRHVGRYGFHASAFGGSPNVVSYISAYLRQPSPSLHRFVQQFAQGGLPSCTSRSRKDKTILCTQRQKGNFSPRGIWTVNCSAEQWRAVSQEYQQTFWQILKLQFQKLVILGGKPIRHYISSACHTSFHDFSSYFWILYKHISTIYAYLQNKLHNFEFP